jgi:hypothetical protein
MRRRVGYGLSANPATAGRASLSRPIRRCQASQVVDGVHSRRRQLKVGVRCGIPVAPIEGGSPKPSHMRSA